MAETLLVCLLDITICCHVDVSHVLILPGVLYLLPTLPTAARQLNI
jgi:hypothetical protein